MIENESGPEVAAATSPEISGASEFSSSAVSSFSRKYNALGGTFTHPAPSSPGWVDDTGFGQDAAHTNDNSAGRWTFPVAPGVPIAVSAEWVDAPNRSKVVVFRVIDGSNVVATVTLNQQLAPDAAAAAAVPPLASIPGTTGTNPDPDATDDTSPTPVSAPYATLWTGAPASHTMAVEIHKDASDTSTGTYALADNLLVQSNSPLPQPAKVDVAQVGPSGRLIVLRLTDQIGNDATVQSIDATKPPTIQVNGGAGNGQSGSTGTIPLTSPIWESAYQSDPLPYVAFPTTFAIGTGDTVTVSVQDSWCKTSAGACGTAPDLAATNLVGGSLLPAFVPDTKTMKLGTNVDQPNALQVAMPFADLVRQVGDWEDQSGHYDFTTDSSGNVLTMGSAPFLLSRVAQPLGNPAEPTRNYPSCPAGIFTLIYEGGVGQLIPANDYTSRTIVSGPTTDRNNVTTVVYDFAATDPGLGVAVAFLVTSAPCVLKHIYPPDPSSPSTRSLDGSSTFHPEFLRMVSGYRCLRFMDALQTNDSNVVDFGDFNVPANLSYGRNQNKPFGGPVASIGPYDNADGFFPPGGAIPVLFTTGTPHGIKEGQFVTLYGFVGPGEGGSNPPGQFPVSNPTGSINLNNAVTLAHVLSPTTFAGRIGTNVVGAVPGQGLSTTYQSVGANARAAGSSQIGWPIIQCVNLCNAAGADLWINVPHAATDACITAMFELIATALNPGLRVHVEYSNETWNFQFLQNGYCIEKGQQAGLSLDAWYVFRANQVHDLAAAVFATFGRGGDLIRVIGTQGGWFSGVGLNRVDYAADNNIPIDELAIAPYFWSGPLVDGSLGRIFDTLAQEQFMDLAELYISGGAIDTFVQGNVDVLKSRYPTATVVCYEGGPEYGGLSGSADLGARSRAWARHPRMRGIMLYFLQTLQDHGVTLYNDYRLFAGVGSANNVAGAAMWPTYIAWNQSNGRGDGSDGLFDNRTDYEALDRIVSVVGGALSTWNGLVPATKKRVLRMLFRSPAAARRG